MSATADRAAEPTAGREVRRSERLEARVTPELKELMQRAAYLEGRTLSDYIADSMRRAAEQTIRDHEVMTLTERGSRAFVEALLAPAPPNEELRAAIARYKREAVSV